MSVSLVRSRPIKEGSITANGTEQTVIELSELVTIYGWIDLSSMSSGDTVIIRYYVRIEAGGALRKYAEETFINAQANPMIRFPPVTARYGIKITLQQTSGTFKSFKYQFFKGVM